MQALDHAAALYTTCQGLWCVLLTVKTRRKAIHMIMVLLSPSKAPTKRKKEAVTKELCFYAQRRKNGFNGIQSLWGFVVRSRIVFSKKKGFGRCRNCRSTKHCWLFGRQMDKQCPHSP